MLLVALIFALASFVVSAAAGMGGSLLLVPSLALILGTKEGVAAAALLLAANNVFKVAAYRKTIPLRTAIGVAALTGAGALLGARLLVAAPEAWVDTAIILSVVSAFVLEGSKLRNRPGFSGVYAFASGATSGFSGTSGPLKGISLRSLSLDRLHLVGAASVVSLTGDASKVLAYSRFDLLTAEALQLCLFAFPLMPLATWAGKSLNTRLGERLYGRLFWGVMAGYTVRLVLVH